MEKAETTLTQTNSNNSACVNVPAFCWESMRERYRRSSGVEMWSTVVFRRRSAEKTGNSNSMHSRILRGWMWLRRGGGNLHENRLWCVDWRQAIYFLGGGRDIEAEDERKMLPLFGDSGGCGREEVAGIISRGREAIDAVVAKSRRSGGSQLNMDRVYLKLVVSGS